MKGNIYEI